MADQAGLRSDLDALLFVAAIWFLGQYLRYAFPPLFETFQADFGVTNTTLGLLFSAMMLAYAAMQFPSGALADRVGPVRVVAAGAVGVGVGSAMVVGAGSFGLLVAAVVVLGVTTGAHKTVAISLLSRLYPDRTGRAVGVMDTVGQFGGVVAPAGVVAVLAAALAWQWLFVAAAAAGGLLGVGVLLRLRGRLASRRAVASPADEAPEAAGQPASGADDDGARAAARAYLAPFADLSLVLAVVAAVSFTVAWNGLSAFLPLYLTAAKGLSAPRAGLLYSLLFVAGLVQPLTGALADRLGAGWVMAGTLGLAGAGLAGLLATGHPWLVAATVPLVGAGLHGFRPARDAYLMAVIPARVAGGTLGITRTAMMVAGSAAPAAVGYLSDVASFAAAFGALVGVLAAGAAVSTWLSLRAG